MRITYARWNFGDEKFNVPDYGKIIIENDD